MIEGTSGPAERSCEYVRRGWSSRTGPHWPRKSHELSSLIDGSRGWLSSVLIVLLFSLAWSPIGLGKILGLSEKLCFDCIGVVLGIPDFGQLVVR